MIQKEELDKIDKSGMYKIYDSWPEIAEECYKRVGKQNNFKKPSHIVFAGVGGSGAINDVFAAILSRSNIHVEVVKGYLLPKTVNEETLVITTSVSGNTVETLNVLLEAKKLDCNIIAFSNGGKMGEICKKELIEFRKILMVHSPRTSFVSFLFSMLKELESILPISKNEILESIDELKKIREKIDSKNLTNSNIAISLANEIKNIPIIYYPWGLQAACIRFKNSLQENSKMHVITEDIIEASHNGIVAWEWGEQIKPILIQGHDDFIKTKERWKIIKGFFEKNNIEYKEIFSIKGGILSKLIQLIYLFDYTSIYLSVIRKIDPTPVIPIDFIKKELMKYDN
ncbi:MAG: glucose-6-phosphate isomerase [Thaumarchaeota archaeon]|jgi:glucose/mannose-6-phosphate isomerase|nr:MAG: glucose-6-phosphate isomerase [Nitrososphaerota archaeon]